MHLLPPHNLPLLLLGAGLLASCGPEVQRTHFDSGQVWTEIELSGGRRHGLYRELFQDGLPKEEGGYRHGVPDGVWRRYHPGGQLSFEEHWSGGMRDGRTAGWFEDGSARFEGQWSDGDRSGEWTFWRPDGSVDAREVWESGTRVLLERP